jgi:hypothetical protein
MNKNGYIAWGAFWMWTFTDTEKCSEKPDESRQKRPMQRREKERVSCQEANKQRFFN